jgi:BirA family transcriptional regulator, biotin operon repressor / biotin---[acetyl-CoA-carboxylase] ligase
VLAEEQVAGRGRAGREWSSPPGAGLWFSVIARPDRPEDIARFPLRIGLAVAAGLDRWAGDRRVRVKWPNDLLLNQRKVGGILCEASWRGGAPDHLIVGIGLNLAQQEGDFPHALRADATSLGRELGAPVDRLEVATAVMQRIGPIAAGEHTVGGVELQALFEGRDALLDRVVRVQEPDGSAPLRGRARGIDSNGALLLETEPGQLRRVVSGTVRAEPGPAEGGH